MTVTPYQPVLPAEIPPTDAEMQVIQETPSIFPDNQNSNWGLKRKIFADQLQALIDQQTLMYAERFIATSDTFLDEWEFQLGLPTNPTGVLLNDRRIRAAARLHNGSYTHARMTAIIEPYIRATFGSAPQFTPSGIPIVVGGVPLFSDASGDVTQYYRIYEDFRNFAQTVLIRSDVTPDMAAMTRDLKRIAPAGIAANLTVDNSLANIIDYTKVILNDQPVLYLKLNGNVNDSSGYGYNGALVGSGHDPANVASPGLLHANVAGTNAAMDFDGVDDYFNVALTGALVINSGVYSLEGIIRLDNIPVSHNHYIFYTFDTQLLIGVGSSGIPKLNGMVFVNGASNFLQSVGSSADTTVGQIIHVGMSYDGSHQKLFLNGVKVAEQALPGVAPIWTGGQMRFGSPGGVAPFFDGAMDELAIYNYPLAEEKFAIHNKARQNIY